MAVAHPAGDSRGVCDDGPDERTTDANEEIPAMAEVRTASTVWTGDLASGSGMITYVGSGVFSRLPITWASRTEAHNGKTSPEELLAAAHASCFSMALASRLGKNGTPADRMDVTAKVTFDKTDAGWGIARSDLTVTVKAAGLDAAKLAELAEDAKDKCPVSRALAGNVAVSVTATLTA
jgi:osmotically inducible protein OsmC